MDDTAPPSPATRAALDACASAVAAEHAARYRTVAAVAALARTDAVVETGHRSLSKLLVEVLRVDAGEARRLIRHAALLVAPEPTPFVPDGPPVLPATAQVASEGGLGAGHVEVIHTTVDRLQAVSPPLPVRVVEEVERQLADLAQGRSPQQLADAAHEVLLRYDPDGEQPHDSDRPVEELRLHTGRDGVVSGRFRLAEPDTAELFRAAIESRTPAPDPDAEADTTPLRPGRSLDARRGEALRLLAHDAGPADPHPDITDDHPDVVHDPAAQQPDDQPADQLASDDEPADEDPGESGAEAEAESDPARGSEPSRPARERPSRETTVIVTVDLDTLTGDRDPTSASTRGWQGFGLLDGLHPLSPAAARRLACDASVIPGVMGSRGEPLDLGRKTRVISTAQRRAVIARDRHCAHPGCRRSPRRCDVHHVVPWHQHGPTDLQNLVLLCAYHHHQHHHSDWHIQMIDGIPTFIPPAWLDPLQTPRTNRVRSRAA